MEFVLRLMKITLLLNGRTEEHFLAEAFAFYAKRLKHYVNFETIEIPDPKSTKSLTTEQYKEKERELTEKNFSQGDHVVLLDERGKQLRSVEFADYLQWKMNSSVRNLVFIIGGPYGFSDKIIQRADEKLSLSRMTFSHQMVRVFFVEQLYRAFTILKNEPYHHE
jgi:23S rRNA (pseudouridine1915-N3)-methyltransferase